MSDVRFELDPTSKTPLYKQISFCIEEAVLSGALKIGDRLPPTRHLATRLGTARRTIVKAYNELTCRGFVECKIGVGTVVSSSCLLLASRSAIVPLPAVNEFPIDLPASHRVDTEQFFDLKIQSREMAGCQSLKVSRYAQALSDQAVTVPEDSEFVSSLEATELLPRKLWRQLTLQGFTRWDDENVGTELIQKHLSSTLHQFLTRRKGVVCRPEQLLIFSGPAQSIAFVARLLIDPGDSIALENPCAPALRTLFSCYGAQISNLPIDLHGADSSKLFDLPEKLCGVQPKLAYVTPSCQNPTGVVMRRERRTALVNWAQQNNGLILEEALDSDVRFGAQKSVLSIQAMLPEATLFLYSFHKILHPLTSTTVVVVPEALLAVARRLYEELPDTNTPEAAFRQGVLNDFICRGFMDSHLTKLCKTFQERRQILLFSLATGLRQAICLSTATAGTQVVFSIDPTFDENFVLECGTNSGLPIRSLKVDYDENKPINEFSISFSSLTTEQLRIGVEKFCSLLARVPAASANRLPTLQVETEPVEPEDGSTRTLQTTPDTILHEKQSSQNAGLTICAYDTTSGIQSHLNTAFNGQASRS